MNLMTAPRDFPQFGRSLTNVARTRSETFGGSCGATSGGPHSRSRCQGTRSEDKGECGCGGSCGGAYRGKGCGCGLGQTESTICEACSEQPVIPEIPWGGSPEVHGNSMIRAAQQLLDQLSSLDIGLDQACQPIVESAEGEGGAWTCRDIPELFKSMCTDAKASCPVERVRFWLCNVPLTMRCKCVNPWRILPNGKERNPPGGSFGELPGGYSDLPEADEATQGLGGCRWEKSETCACLCWIEGWQLPPDLPRLLNVPCDRLGKKERRDFSMWSSEFYLHSK